MDLGGVQTWEKRRRNPPQGLFAAEAAGLRWLRVPGGIEVAEVLDVTEEAIILSKVRAVAPTQQAAEEFGAALSVTHDAGAGAFGSPPQGFCEQSYIADLPMSTEPMTTWGTFFAEQRILPYANHSHLGSRGMHVIESLAQRLDDGVFDDAAPPARLHGDLWSGNVLFSPTGVVLIDPSAHGGHRITDLAMLSLFGVPYLDTILASYEQVSSHLPDHWRDLIGLHQVYPLLVHAVLFGGHNADAAIRTAENYLR